MSAVMSDAESKFFSSRGTEVDASLTAADPVPASPAESAPAPPAEKVPEPTASEPKAAEAPKDAPKAGEPAKAAEAPKPAEATPPAKAEPAKTPDGFVPQQALHTERQKRQQLEEQNRQLQAQIQQVQQWIQAQQQAPEQPPNPAEDPYGALQYELAQQRKQLEQANQWREQQEQSQRQQRAMADLNQRLMSSEHIFRATHPDYDAAADHALQQYDRLLSASVPDPIQRQQQVRIEAANALARAIQNGQDPAEFIYTLARNMGYTPAAPAAVTPPAAVAPATVPPAAPPSTVSDVAQTLERGLKQQAKSGGGASPGGEMTAEQLAAINDPAAFNEAWKKAFRK